MDDYIISELQKIINETKSFPSRNKLIALGRGDLLYKIDKNGGINKFRSKMGYLLSTAPYFYFKDLNNILTIIEECKSSLGYTNLPTIIELDKFRPGIKFAINKYHGGYRKIRDILNEKQLIKPDGYWKDFNNVYAEIKLIEKITLSFPTVSEINTYGPPGLYAGINLYHGGLIELQEKMNSPITYKSKLEQRVKLLLNQYVDSSAFVDNYRSKLKKQFNLTLINPKTGRPLELDRYYYDYKIAVEIQGEQHEKEASFFARQKQLTPKQYLSEIQKLDLLKKKQCEEQGVTIVYIYDYMDNTTILNTLSRYLPIRTEPLKLKNTDLTLENILLNLELKKGAAITSEDIKRESQPLYKEVLHKYGTLNEARKAIGLIHIKESPNSWTLDKVINELNPIVSSLGRMPKKHEISQSLYYGIQKYGGLIKLSKLVLKKS